MPSNIVGVPANANASPFTSPAPVDGDAGTADSVRVFLQDVADVLAVLQAQGARKDAINAFTPDQQFYARILMQLAGDQQLWKSGGKLQLGTISTHDVELFFAGALRMAMTTSGIDAKNQLLYALGRILFQGLTADPAAPTEGTVWYRTDLDKLRAMVGAGVQNLATEDYVGGLSMKAGGRLVCSAGGTVAVSEGVNIASASWSTNVLSINYSSPLPSVTRPYIFNDYPATGARLCRCTANLTTAITIRRLDLSGADSAWAVGDTSRLAVF